MATSHRWTPVVVWFVASRLVIGALGVVGVATFVNQRTGVVIDNVSALNPETVWHKWDSLWYERIARHGYGHELDTPQGQAAAAFFPLYPLTVGALLAVMPGASFFWVASVFSNLLALGALLWMARSLMSSDEQTQRVIALTLTSAGSFYLSIPYTESLFLLLVVGTLVATRRGRFEIAGLLAGLAATTRVHGFPLIAVPVLACWLDAAQGPRRGTRAAVTIAAFTVPVAAYFAYLADAQGSWGAFVARQTMWDNPTPYPFQAVWAFVAFPRRVSNWVHGAFWILYLGLLIRYWKKMPLGEALFCLGVFVISTQQDAFHGIYRYMTPLLPLTFAIAEDRPEVQRRLIALNIAFGVLMILAFVTYNRLAV
jgi:Gpi18-like mannosyltransferase